MSKKNHQLYIYVHVLCMVHTLVIYIYIEIYTNVMQMHSFSGGEDNSDVAMGTVLSQREGDNLHVDLVTHSKVVFFLLFALGC